MNDEMPAVIWTKPCEVPQELIGYVDDNVLAMLPAGTKVIAIQPHGSSYWTRTARIKTLQDGKSTLDFFLKVSQDETGKGMMLAEFVATQLISRAAKEIEEPRFAPKPIAWGSYASASNVHFFLCSFHAMDQTRLPDIDSLSSTLAKFHQRGVSPNGKYGFPVTTYQGNKPQYTGWEISWEIFFGKNMKMSMDIEDQAQGLDEEVCRLKGLILHKVIPRLLRPLETEGRDIEPCLVHTDLWDGNMGVHDDDEEDAEIEADEESPAYVRKPIIFDPAALFAHHEYELGPWRATRLQIAKISPGETLSPYIQKYEQYNHCSQPAEDFADRILLYCIRWDMCSSALYPGNLWFRERFTEDMRTLVEKYPDGYLGKHLPKGTTTAGVSEGRNNE